MPQEILRMVFLSIYKWSFSSWNILSLSVVLVM
jgi:hypothetical protein